MMQPSFCARIAAAPRACNTTPVEVDLDELVPAFQLHVGPAAFRHIDAGAVDQKIDAAMMLENLFAALFTSSPC